MKTANIRDAKTYFSQLLRRVEAGEEIVIAKAGRPVARLVPVKAGPPRGLGSDRGTFAVPEDFDAPLPAEVRTRFEG